MRGRRDPVRDDIEVIRSIARVTGARDGPAVAQRSPCTTDARTHVIDERDHREERRRRDMAS